MRKLLLYLIRWQLSTPILWLVIKNLGVGIETTILANLIGGLIFFWVDKFIFTSNVVEMWHFQEKNKCHKCGKVTKLWRLVMAPNYDKRKAKPIFLCSDCSKNKTEELRKRGIKMKNE